MHWAWVFGAWRDTERQPPRRQEPIWHRMVCMVKASAGTQIYGRQVSIEHSQRIETNLRPNWLTDRYDYYYAVSVTTSFSLAKPNILLRDREFTVCSARTSIERWIKIRVVVVLVADVSIWESPIYVESDLIEDYYRIGPLIGLVKRYSWVKREEERKIYRNYR